MGALGRAWSWLWTSAGTAFDRGAWLLLGVTALALLAGISLLESTAARRRRVVAPRHLGQAAGAKAAAGPSASYLRAEWRAKVGAMAVAWAVALALGILLRPLLGTPGVSTPLLPALVLATALPFVAYAVVYRLRPYPRYLAECRRADTRGAYAPSPRAPRSRGGGQAKARAQVRRKVELAPGKATLGLIATPFVFYFVLVPHPPTMHDVHQAGMLVAALLGYAGGLALSLGDGVRTGSLWAPARGSQTL